MSIICIDKAIYSNNLDCVTTIITKNAYTPIPLEAIEHAVKSENVAILKVLLQSQYIAHHIELYGPTLLHFSIDVKKLSLWKRYKHYKAVQASQPIHLLTSKACPSTIKYILSHSPPLIIPENKGDTLFLQHVYEQDTSLLAWFTSSVVTIQSPSTYHRGIETCIINKQWMFPDWVFTHQQGAYRNQSSLCTSYLNLLITRFSAARLSAVELRVVTSLLYFGAIIKNTAAHYGFISHLCKDNAGVNALRLVLEQNIISIDGSHWHLPDLMSISITHAQHDITDLLLSYGAPIPPNIDLLSTTFPHHILLTLVMGGYIITPEVLYHYTLRQKHRDVLLFLRSAPPSVFVQLRQFLDAPTNTMPSQFSAFISNMLSTDDGIDVIDIFSSHGFTFPDVCGDHWRPLHHSPPPCSRAVTYMVSKWAIDVNQLGSNGLTPLYNAVYNLYDSLAIALYNNGAMLMTRGSKGDRHDVFFHLFLFEIDHPPLIKYTLDFIMYDHVVDSDDDDEDDEDDDDGDSDDNDNGSNDSDSYVTRSSTGRSLDRQLLDAHDSVVTKLLIDSNCNVNAVNGNGKGSLFNITDVLAAQLLITHGANINNYVCPTHSYTQHLSPTVDIIDECIKVQDSTSLLPPSLVYDMIFSTPILSAVRYGAWDVAQLLIEYGSPPHPPSNDLCVPLLPLVIARFKDMEKVQYLIHHGVDIFDRDPLGFYSLQVAIISRLPDIVRLLIGYGADISHHDILSLLLLHGPFQLFEQIPQWVIQPWLNHITTDAGVVDGDKDHHEDHHNTSSSSPSTINAYQVTSTVPTHLAGLDIIATSITKHGHAAIDFLLPYIDFTDKTLLQRLLQSTYLTPQSTSIILQRVNL